EVAPPGEGFAVSAFLWNAGAAPVTVSEIGLVSPDGWTAAPAAAAPAAAAPRAVPPNTLADWKLAAAIPADAAIPIPYFLRRPMQGDPYDWSAAPAPVRGEPFQPPPLSARAAVTIGGVAVTLEREVVYRYRDQAIGEIRRPIRCGPRVDVAVEPDLIVWPTSRSKPRTIDVTLFSSSDKPQKGRIEVAVPDGWTPIEPRSFELARR